MSQTYHALSHYKIFAVPMKRLSSGRKDFAPELPVKLLNSKAVSAHLVTRVSDPLPFVVEKYSAEKLPEELRFDGKWMREAFKSGMFYSFVVAAFTKTQETVSLFIP